MSDNQLLDDSAHGSAEENDDVPVLNANVLPVTETEDVEADENVVEGMETVNERIAVPNPDVRNIDERIIVQNKPVDESIIFHRQTIDEHITVLDKTVQESIISQIKPNENIISQASSASVPTSVASSSKPESLTLETVLATMLTMQENMTKQNSLNATLMLQMQQQMLQSFEKSNSKDPVSEYQKNHLADVRTTITDGYHGHKDVNKIERFLKNLELYAKTAKLDDCKTIDAFGIRMQGKAHGWWTNLSNRLTNLPVDMNNCRWPSVKKAFRQAFYPANFALEQYIRWHLLSIKSSGSLIKFVRDFRDHLSQLLVVDDTVSEIEQWKTLVGQLDQPALDHLELKKIHLDTRVALDELEQHAAAKVVDMKKGRDEATNKSAVVGARVNSIKPTVMKRTHDDSSNFGPAKQRRPNTKTNPKPRNTPAVDATNFNNFQLFPHIFPELREYINSHNGCGYCRNLNVPVEHTSDWCAKRKNKGKPVDNNNKKDF